MIRRFLEEHLIVQKTWQNLAHEDVVILEHELKVLKMVVEVSNHIAHVILVFLGFSV